MARKAKSTSRKKRKSKARTSEAPWALRAAAVILGFAVLRLGINALDWVPVHFDEGQYWAYGLERAAGHFSKPPLVGWIISATTGIGGDTTFALRIGAVVAHAAVAAMVYLTGRAMFDGRTGFWAAAGYTVAPGVSVSSMIMSTDPVMMAFWAVALFAWVRAAETGGRAWWALMGAAIGAAMLAKYTALAFVGAAVGYGLFSLRGRDWTGVALAAVTGLVVFAPNLLWQITNDFHTVGHVAEDAAPPGSRYNVGKLFEFLGAQLGVLGPVWFLGMLTAFWFRREWVDDWKMRMLGWQTYALLFAMIGLAFWTRAQPNWAAPAYVAGSILVARWLLTRKWEWALKAQAGIGALGALAVYIAAFAYAVMPLDLPRSADPFKKMRLSEPFCGPALANMAEEGAELLLSNDRRRLSECMFLGGFGFEGIAVWNPDEWPDNHHELVSSLQLGEDRPLLLVALNPEVARQIAASFEDAREIETGTFDTHKGRTFGYSIWAVQGFRGY